MTLAATGVVVPVLASVKVEPFIVEAFIASEKVASTSVVGPTSFALFAGTTALTVGGVVSSVEGGLAAWLTPSLNKSKESAKTSPIELTSNC